MSGGFGIALGDISLRSRFVIFALKAFYTYVYEPATVIVDTVSAAALRVFPSYVAEVRVLPPNTQQLTPIYKASLKTGYSWPRAFPTTTFLPATPDTYYFIRTWNATKQRRESYYLSAHHLSAALGIKSPATFWTLSDFGIVSQLSSYMEGRSSASTQRQRLGIFEIRWGTHYLITELREFIRSLELPDNLTARAICLLYESLYPERVAEWRAAGELDEVWGSEAEAAADAESDQSVIVREISEDPSEEPVAATGSLDVAMEIARARARDEDAAAPKSWRLTMIDYDFEESVWVDEETLMES